MSNLNTQITPTFVLDTDTESCRDVRLKMDAINIAYCLIRQEKRNIAKVIKQRFTKPHEFIYDTSTGRIHVTITPSDLII